MAKWRAYPGAGSWTANSSLAPRVSPRLSDIAKFSPNLTIPGIHLGVAGARPVVYTSRNSTPNYRPLSPKL